VVKCGQLSFCKPVSKKKEAVTIPLPVSMHTGQIILLTKMLANADLAFYEFTDSKPVRAWQREVGN
jgi:hypothetical protein